MQEPTDRAAPAVSVQGLEGPDRAEPSPRAAIEALTAEVLPALIARLGASDLGEIEIRTPAWRVRLRRAFPAAGLAPGGAGGAGGASHRTVQRAPLAGPSERSAASTGRLTGPGDRQADPTTSGRATAPGSGHAGELGRQGQGGAGQPVMAVAGTPGRGDSRGAPAREGDSRGSATPDRRAATSPAVGYFSPRDEMRRGQRVQAGDVLGVVDVLGVRHEVTAPIDGFISRQIALVGEAVEYGQPLVEIEGLPARPRAGSGSPGSPLQESLEPADPPPGGGAVVVGEAV